MNKEVVEYVTLILMGTVLVIGYLAHFFPSRGHKGVEEEVTHE